MYYYWNHIGQADYSVFFSFGNHLGGESCGVFHWFIGTEVLFDKLYRGV